MQHGAALDVGAIPAKLRQSFGSIYRARAQRAREANTANREALARRKCAGADLQRAFRIRDYRAPASSSEPRPECDCKCRAKDSGLDAHPSRHPYLNAFQLGINPQRSSHTPTHHNRSQHDTCTAVRVMRFKTRAWPKNDDEIFS